LLKRFLVMDDASFKSYFSSFLLLMLLLSSLRVFGSDASYEYVTPNFAQSLAREFAHGKVPVRLQGAWTCDMYGMRTRIRVKRATPLYNWSARADGWTNSGAQPVAAYKRQGNSIEGTSKKLPHNVVDEVRTMEKGRLISRLSLAESPQTILAYSICTAP
jgi:hypothetical protein